MMATKKGLSKSDLSMVMPMTTDNPPPPPVVKQVVEIVWTPEIDVVRLTKGLEQIYLLKNTSDHVVVVVGQDQKGHGHGVVVQPGTNVFLQCLKGARVLGLEDVLAAGYVV